MKSITKLRRGKATAFNHALNDVAVVAKQASRLLAVMAVIGFRLARAYVSRADSAFGILHGHKCIEGDRVHSSAVLPESGLVVSMKRRIGFDLLPPCFALALCFFAAIPLVATSSDIGSAIILFAACFCFLSLVVGFAFFKPFHAVPLVGSAGNSEIFLPLFGSAITLLHPLTPFNWRRFISATRKGFEQ